MEEWKEYRLGEVCRMIPGFAFKSNEFGIGSHIVIKIKDIQPPYVETKDADNVDISKYDIDKLSKFIVHKGEFLLAMTGATIGKIGRYLDEAPAYINQRVLKFQDVGFISYDYLYYYLSTDIFQSFILNHIDSQSAQPNISSNTIGKYLIKVPSFDTQNKIISILKSLDDKIEVNRRINDNIEQQAQALFKSWFVDFEPFKDQPFVDSELGMIPKGWRVDTIYEYINVIYGAPYKSSLFNENKDGLPLIRIRDLKTNAPQFYTPEILPNTEYIEAGDIVAGMDAEFVPYVWLGEKGVLNQRCCKFKAKNDAISNYYVLFLVKPELEYVQSYKTGTTVSHLGKSDIDRFKFITPSMDVVLAFSKIVNPIIKEVVNNAKESRRLATLRDTLLPKLISGELNISDIKV